ncbi:hypothetical protein PC121_g21879 [Phytophthora cactorum]|nr:hypothetical protein PC121_g21879 [Phytophthora cactorum]KAG4040103.1 hypothetical protein PC123_g24356 [Phytophthora cactorum]
MMRLAEAQAKERRATSNEGSFQTKFETDREASVETDPVLQLVNSPVADMFTTGEPGKSSLVPVFGRRSFVDDICFGGEDFDSRLATLDRLLTRFAQCRISISFTKSIFCQPKVDFLSHEISPEGIKADSKKPDAITELSFPTSKRGMQSFLGALNYYRRFIQDFAVYGAALYQLKEEDFGPGGDLSVAHRAFEALQTKVAEATILKPGALQCRPLQAIRKYPLVQPSESFSFPPGSCVSIIQVKYARFLRVPCLRLDMLYAFTLCIELSRRSQCKTNTH